jgi:hypothetical protein
LLKVSRYAAGDVLAKREEVAAASALVAGCLKLVQLSLELGNVAEKRRNRNLLSIIIHRSRRVKVAEEFEVPSVWEFEE